MPGTKLGVAQNATPALSPGEQEQFLKTAKVVRTRGAGAGITGTTRVTLSDGQVTHDAHVQGINEARTEFSTSQSTEMNFKDSYKFNIAGYRLARLLGIGGMVPVSVERKIGGTTSAVTWWVDGVAMDETRRVKDAAQPPDAEQWSRQMNIVRVFDQLIHNTDRNGGNLVITGDWKLWMIDHTRAFRIARKLNRRENLVRCERALFEKLKQLDRAALETEMKGYLNSEEIKGLLARRDLIVEHFENQAKARGEAVIFYDYGR
ncbi:MAG: hypothetical protein FJW39_31565 [Acidobacteria bacterium]|nr:hypothetical protein [Acidobacteriota bacterium]